MAPRPVPFFRALSTVGTVVSDFRWNCPAADAMLVQ